MWNIGNQLEKLEAAKAAWLAVLYSTVLCILQVVSDTFHREHAAFNLLFEAITSTDGPIRLEKRPQE